MVNRLPEEMAAARAVARAALVSRTARAALARAVEQRSTLTSAFWIDQEALQATAKAKVESDQHGQLRKDSRPLGQGLLRARGVHLMARGAGHFDA